MQYFITGGQLKIDKLVFTRELLLPDSPVKSLLKTIDIKEGRQPSVAKKANTVIIDYNEASDVIVDENFHEMFKKLKIKYKEKLKGKVVIRITALTSYHVTLDLNSDDETIGYE
jgi:hypothetical protein